jgi:hypothetical protein
VGRASVGRASLPANLTWAERRGRPTGRKGTFLTMIGSFGRIGKSLAVKAPSPFARGEGWGEGWLGQLTPPSP